MSWVRRIFVIADFKDEKPQSVFVDDRRIVKGLIRLGHDVQRFSYRNIMLHRNPFPNKPFIQYFTKQKADKILLKQVKHYYPDIVLALGMKYFDAETVVAMRSLAPNAVILGRDLDPFPEKFPVRLAAANQMDIIVMPSSGRFLKVYKDAGVHCCAFIPCSCDPDIQYRYEVQDKWKGDIVFTGKAEHTKLDRNDERYNIVKKLSRMPNVKLYGCFGRPRTEGIDCFYALSGAKIGLSINIANDVRLYHSDRFINIPACGTFTLAKRAPGYELLFEDGVHLKYFDTVDEFFELADWYLKHEQQREKIAMAGMKKAHADFNCQKIAQHILDLVETGSYSAPWAEIL
ncbi:MAG: glycosyltransferase [Sedimentisphaerales bacterium]